MTIAQYIESIANALSTPNTFLQGKAWETNIDMDFVEVFPCVVFRNYFTSSFTLGRDGKARWQDYPITVEFHLLEDELDMETSDIEDEIFAILLPVVDEFVKRIYESTEYQVVDQQVSNQNGSVLYFRDEKDVITAGLQLNLTVRLRLQNTVCL